MLAKFDPALGVLTAVDLTLTATIVQDLKLESQDAAPATVIGTGKGTITVTPPTAHDNDTPKDQETPKAP